MKIKIHRMLGSHWAIGLRVDNWGYPERNEWAISVDILRWNIGLEFFK